MGGVPISHWMSQLEPLPPPRPALPGPRDADVCIVGAGYTGLWTALELRRADPSLDVLVLEAQTAGFGASGRNGGWVIGRLAGRRERWAQHAGRDATTALLRATEDAVAEVGAAAAREGIDCDFAQDGSLTVAQTPLELDRLRRETDADRAWGLTAELLDPGAVAARVEVDRALGAAFTPHCARIQPARLVRGLADAAEGAGATIHERTPVTAIEPGRARTAAGDVRARVIVRATEGYTARLPGQRRALLPMNSSMIVTEPLGDRVVWHGAPTLLDGLHRYCYLQRTTDGRIAIGGRGVPYRFGSRSDREGPVPARTVAELRARLTDLFPALAGVRVDGAWHGVLGVPRDWSPSVGLDRRTGIAWAGGYVGDGVAASNLAGRTLRDLVLGHDSDLTRLPWVGTRGPRWEPEPLRFAGVHLVYGLFAAADRRERRTGRPALAGRLGHRIAGY